MRFIETYKIKVHEGVKWTMWLQGNMEERLLETYKIHPWRCQATGNGYLLTHIKSIKESINLNKTPQARDPQVKINLSPKDKHCEL